MVSLRMLDHIPGLFEVKKTGKVFIVWNAIIALVSGVLDIPISTSMLGVSKSMKTT
jgi:hypothetical protein